MFKQLLEPGTFTEHILYIQILLVVMGEYQCEQEGFLVPVLLEVRQGVDINVMEEGYMKTTSITVNSPKCFLITST